MASGDNEHPSSEDAPPIAEGPTVPQEVEDARPDAPQEDDAATDELLFRTPFPRPRPGALRNILATIAVGAVIVGLVLFFDRPGGGFGSEPITLTASATGAAPRVGKEAPDFRVVQLDGEYFQLSDHRGHPVWINFWATWCPPCRAENPDIQAVYDENRADGLVVIAVDIGESTSTVRGYMERTGFDFPVGMDRDTSIAAQYRIVGVPTHYFVDSDGILRDWRIGGMSKKAMEEKVEAIMSAGAEDSNRND